MAPAGAPAVILAGGAMPPAAATDATAPDADADARVAAAPDAAAPAAAPTAPAAESTGPTAPVAPPARLPAMPPSGASDGPNADEPPAASPDAPAATAATARDARDTPDATRVPASVEQCAAVLRQHMGPDHPFAVSYSPSDNPKHHNTTVYCELPECRKAGGAYRPGGGGMEKTKPSLINFARNHCGWTKSHGFNGNIGDRIHRAAVAAAAARRAAGTTATDVGEPASDAAAEAFDSTSDAAASEAAPGAGAAAAAEPGAAVAAEPSQTERAAENAASFQRAKDRGEAWATGYCVVMHDGRHHLVCEFCNGEKIITLHHHNFHANCNGHRGACQKQKPAPAACHELTHFFRPANA